MRFRSPISKRSSQEGGKPLSPSVRQQQIEKNTHFNLISTESVSPRTLGSINSSESRPKDVILEGFLNKRSRHIAQWRHRWCVLSGHYLSCYRRQGQYVNATEDIDLRVFNNVKISSTSSSRFKIFRKGYGSFHFDCEYESQCQLWISEIQRIIDKNTRRVSAAVSVNMKKRVQFGENLVQVKHRTPEMSMEKQKSESLSLQSVPNEPVWYCLIPITDGLHERHFLPIVGQRLINKIRFQNKYQNLIEIKLDQHGQRWYKRRNKVLLRDIPNVNVSVFGSEGPEFYRACELLKGPRVLVFTMPAVFTPTSERHVPTYVNNLEVFRKNAIAVFCIATTDPFCMNAFKQMICPDIDKSGITFVSDQSMHLMEALSKTINLTYVGLGVRGARTAFYCENGKITKFWEDLDPFQVSETHGAKIIEDLGLLNTHSFIG